MTQLCRNVYFITLLCSGVNVVVIMTRSVLYSRGHHVNELMHQSVINSLDINLIIRMKLNVLYRVKRKKCAVDFFRKWLYYQFRIKYTIGNSNNTISSDMYFIYTPRMILAFTTTGRYLLFRRSSSSSQSTDR